MSDSQSGLGMAVMLAVSRSLGMGLSLALGVLSARYFGTSAVKDTYLVAENVAKFIMTIIVGGLWSNLVIALTEIGPVTGLTGQKQFLRRTCVIVTFVLVLTALLVIVFASPILHLAAPGFTADEISLGRQLMLLTVLGMVANVLFALTRCLFHARMKFALPAFMTLVGPGVSLVTLPLLVDRVGIFAQAIGPAAGALLSLAFLAWAIARLREDPVESTTRIPGGGHSPASQRQLWLPFVPLTLAANAGQINLLVDNLFASTLPTGSIATLGFAFVILSSAEVLTTYPLAEIALSFLAESATRSAQALADSARWHLRYIAIVSLPLAAGFLTFGVPVVRLLFEGGQFTPEATHGVANLLAFYALEIPLMGYGLILYRVLLVRKRQRAIAGAAILSILANASLDYFLSLLLGLNGIALATTLVTLIYVAVLARLARQDLPQIYTRSDLSFLARVLAASVVMGVVVWGFRVIMEGRFDLSPRPSRILEVAVGLSLAMMVYVLGLMALRVQEARTALRSLSATFLGIGRTPA